MPHNQQDAINLQWKHLYIKITRRPRLSVVDQHINIDDLQEGLAD